MSVSTIIESINRAIAGLPGPGEIKEEERLELLVACEKLKSSLESPFEFAIRVMFGVSQQSLSVHFHNNLMADSISL